MGRDIFIPKIDLNDNELKLARTYNQKRFLVGEKKVRLEAHAGHIHYFNKLAVGDGQKRFRELDWSLQWDDKKRGWYFLYHNFQPFIPEFADDWVNFRDLYQKKDQLIKFRAHCNHVKGRLVLPTDQESNQLDGVTDANYVIYDNAFGNGIDFIIGFTRSDLIKLVRIRDGYKPNDNIDFSFDLVIPSELKVKRGYDSKSIEYELDKTISKDFDTNKRVLIGGDPDNKTEENTYFKEFKVWDLEKAQIITTTFKPTLEADVFVLTKHIPVEFLKNSVGDVFTDTTVSYYASGADGGVEYYTGASLAWSTCRGATGSAASVNGNGGTFIRAVESAGASGAYGIARGFCPIDTSGIPDDATINSASFYLSRNSLSNGDNDGNDFAVVVNSNQASTASLVNTDYNDAGTTEYSDRLDFGSIASGYNQFPFNATGLANINKSGYTKLAMREGHDLLNSTIATNQNNDLRARTSAATGTSDDPYLEVDYTPTSTNYEETYSETVTIVDAIDKSQSRILTEAVTIVDSVIKTASRAFSEAITLVDTFIGARLRSTELTEEIDIVDTVQKSQSRTLTEAIPIVDTIVRSSSRLFTETVTIVDTVLKNTARTFSEAVPIADLVTGAKVTLKELSETVTIQDSIVRTISKLNSEVITIVDTLNRSIARTLTQSITIVDTILKTPSKVLSETVTVVDSIVRSTTKTLTQVITVVDAILRVPNRSFIENITITDVLQKTSSRILSEVVTIVDTVVGTANIVYERTFSEVVTVTDTLVKTIMRMFTENISIHDTFIKFTNWFNRTSTSWYNKAGGWYTKLANSWKQTLEE